MAAVSCLRRGALTRSRGGWEPTQQPAIHVEHDREDRDPDHARPHPHEGAASRSCSVRGIAQADCRRVRRPPRRESNRPPGAGAAPIGVIQMSPFRSSARRQLEEESAIAEQFAARALCLDPM